MRKKDLSHEERKKLAGLLALIVTFFIFLFWVKFSFVHQLRRIGDSLGTITRQFDEVVSRAREEVRVPKMGEVRMCSKQEEKTTAYEKERK